MKKKELLGPVCHLEGVLREHLSKKISLNRDLSGVRDLALWIFWRKRQKDSKARGPDPVESLACSGNRGPVSFEPDEQEESGSC